jgi:integrase
MARTLNRLSPLRVQKLKRPGLHADGGSLYLRITDSGTKNWVFRFGDGGKLRDMGLGPLHTISLPRARELARECRELRLQGIDPIAHRRASLAARRAFDAKAMTFRQCAEAYIASHEAGWRNAQHRQQWPSTLAQYAYPIFGALPVAAIDTGLVMKVLEPIWSTKTVTASRLRGRIESVLDWAKARGYREGENPARWRGHIDHLLPAKAKVRQTRHLAALPYTELAGFMAELRQERSMGALALEFAILTAARAGEVLRCTWQEIDLDAKTWTIPASRMKGGREHRVSLSDAAMAVLNRMPRAGHYVFSGTRGHLTHKPLQAVLRKLRPGGYVPHGFRSTFRDWAAERTNFAREVCEMALAHTVGSEVERAYQRSDMLEKRRKLMEAWAQYCSKPAAGGKVVAIRTRG